MHFEFNRCNHCHTAKDDSINQSVHFSVPYLRRAISEEGQKVGQCGSNVLERFSTSDCGNRNNCVQYQTDPKWTTQCSLTVRVIIIIRCLLCFIVCFYSFLLFHVFLIDLRIHPFIFLFFTFVACKLKDITLQAIKIRKQGKNNLKLLNINQEV